MLERAWVTARHLAILVVVSLPALLNQGTLREAIAADRVPQGLINCDIQKGPCTRSLGGASVTLDILPKPVRAMKDLRFLVTVSGVKPGRAPYIDLGMQGMDMGPNRIELKPVKENVYEGQGVIVRCPSGRRTWKAAVTLAGVGKVEFVFDVVH